MQPHPQTESAKCVAPPAKPPRLKANNVNTHVKKQLQFQSPLPGRSRAPPASDAVATMTMKTTRRKQERKTAAKSKSMNTTPDSSVRDANAEADAAIRNRLVEGCTTLMYACLQGDIMQVLAQMRAKVGATTSAPANPQFLQPVPKVSALSNMW